MKIDSDAGALIICAVRYCFGRRTYMVTLVINWVMNHWIYLPKSTQDVIYKDLTDILESGRDLGDACDVLAWRDFYDWIKRQS